MTPEEFVDKYFSDENGGEFTKVALVAILKKYEDEKKDSQLRIDDINASMH